ncbi:amidohydrolase family protein, partial [Saccharomonospora iraqiensis]|uniref:amidohydrolase family protein n=1 Tax=Saccharomonospora iraqiensis TaxID=52698 RepID=UPI00059476F5
GTAAPDGRYPLGRLDVEVTGGVATLPSDGTLAGSTLTMDAAFRHLVRDVGLTVSEAVAATAGHPAALLGLSGTTGALRPGLSADLVVLDADL